MPSGCIPVAAVLLLVVTIALIVFTDRPPSSPPRDSVRRRCSPKDRDDVADPKQQRPPD